MNYDEWATTVPPTLSDDALWKMKVYRYSLFLSEIIKMLLKIVPEERGMRIDEDAPEYTVKSVWDDAVPS